MKAMVVSPVGGRVPPNHRGVLHNGLGIGGTRRDLEAEEVAAYLTKLRSLVPDMPRRKLSKLEVIQRVIEYICDLQTALEETNAAQQDTKTTTVTQSSVRQQPLEPLLNATATTTSTSTTSVVMTTTTSMAATVAER